MLSIKSLVEKLEVFERNKVPLELKVLGLAFYIQLSSLRKATKALSEVQSLKDSCLEVGQEAQREDMHRAIQDA